MGMGGVSMGSLLLIFLIVLLLFGTRRLRDIGEDLGAAVRHFRRGLDGKGLEEPKKTLGKDEPTLS